MEVCGQEGHAAEIPVARWTLDRMCRLCRRQHVWQRGCRLHCRRSGQHAYVYDGLMGRAPSSRGLEGREAAALLAGHVTFLCDAA